MEKEKIKLKIVDLPDNTYFIFNDYPSEYIYQKVKQWSDIAKGQEITSGVNEDKLVKIERVDKLGIRYMFCVYKIHNYNITIVKNSKDEIKS